MRTRLLLLVGLVCLAAVLAGCGGGGGGGATPGVTLNIGADTTPILTRSHTPSRVTALITKLDQGATVTAYDFKTGATLDTGTIGANGFCSLQLTPGLTVVIVVIGSRDGKDYRLSVIIPMVPSVDSEYIACPITTIAAEAIAETYFREGTALDQGTVDAVLEKAGEYVESHPDEDYSIGGGVISGTTFGAEGNLDETELAEVIAAVPTTIVAKYVTAKNAVQQIKEAGIPIAAMVTLEPADIQALFTEEVEQSYGALAERLSQLILPSIMGDLIYGESEMPVFGLTMGQAYKVVDRPDGRVVIADDSAKNTTGQITITDDLSGTGTLTLVAKKTSATDWRLTQTSAGDAQQLYEATVPGSLVGRVDGTEFTGMVKVISSKSAGRSVRGEGLALDFRSRLGLAKRWLGQTTVEGLLGRVKWRGLSVEDGYVVSPRAFADPEGFLHDYGGVSGATWKQDMAARLNPYCRVDVMRVGRPSLLLGAAWQSGTRTVVGVGLAWPQSKPWTPYFRCYPEQSRLELGAVGRGWQVRLSGDDFISLDPRHVELSASATPIRF